MIRLCAVCVAVTMAAAFATSCGSKKSKKASGDEAAKKPSTDAAAPPRKGQRTATGTGRNLALPFESARLVFEQTGDVETGTITAWIAQSGKVVGVMRELTAPQPLKQWILWKDGRTKQWNDRDKTVNITRLRSRFTALRSISTNDPAELELAGYKRRDDDSVAGKPCEVWYNARQKATFCRWYGLDLRHTDDAFKGKRLRVQAKTVEPGVAFPVDTFKPPKDYKIVDNISRD